MCLRELLSIIFKKLDLTKHLRSDTRYISSSNQVMTGSYLFQTVEKKTEI